MGARHTTLHEEDPGEPGRKSVVFVHGLASCALVAKTKPGYKHFVCEGNEEAEFSRLVYISLAEYAVRPHVVTALALAHVQGKKKDGTPCITTTSGEEGVDVHPVLGLQGIRQLNPGEDKTPVSLWQNLYAELEPNYNCFAFNYDWRRWGDQVYIEEVLERFKHNIEDAAELAGHPVALIGHSMGAQVVLYCIGMLGDAWQKKYVEQVVLVGPAPMGSPSMFAAYANGPSSIAHSSVLPVVDYYEHKLSEVSSTWPAMLAELPRMMGTTQTFPADYAFAITPTKRYCLGDVEEFLKDLAACHNKNWQPESGTTVETVRNWFKDHNLITTSTVWEAGHTTAPALFAGMKDMSAAMRRPAVVAHVIYAQGHQTPTQFKWDSEDLYTKAQNSEFQPGDDTVTLASIQAMVNDWRKDGEANVHMHRAPDSYHHKALISSRFSLKKISELLEDCEFDDSEESASEDPSPFTC